jgi:hypothetical protein
MVGSLIDTTGWVASGFGLSRMPLDRQWKLDGSPRPWAAAGPAVPNSARPDRRTTAATAASQLRARMVIIHRP